MKPATLPTMHELVKQVQQGAVSSLEVWEECSKRIERLNPVLNAFITLMEPYPEHPHDPGGADALRRLPLAGMPIAVKDLFETAGTRTTAGSLFFKDHIPEKDAAAVARLRSQGGMIIGKTNTHEIALGVTTVNPHYGACRNPWNPDHVSGGSSGGSAVAVATGMALGALGTDTGGSIRIPASLCGVVGLKPTYGRISLRGVIPLSWNLDHVGPLARSVRDAALLLQALAGYDSEDPHSANVPTEDYTIHLEDGIRGWRAALLSGDYVGVSDAEVLEAVEHAGQVFERVGAQITRVELTRLAEAAMANGLMTQADGATYHRQRLAEHPEMFGNDVRTRLETGRSVSLAEYVLARRTQAETRRELELFFEECEFLLLPATAITAPPISGTDAVQQARRLTRFTAPFNLAGLPAISIPGGFSREGLPIGLQLVAGPWKEARLLQAARAYERETNWLSRQPVSL